jgi:hypothetical protein
LLINAAKANSVMMLKIRKNPACNPVSKMLMYQNTVLFHLVKIYLSRCTKWEKYRAAHITTGRP